MALKRHWCRHLSSRSTRIGKTQSAGSSRETSKSMVMVTTIMMMMSWRLAFAKYIRRTHPLPAPHKRSRLGLANTLPGCVGNVQDLLTIGYTTPSILSFRRRLKGRAYNPTFDMGLKSCFTVFVPMYLSLLFAVAAGAGLTTAQGLSSSCTNTLGQLVTSPDMACLNAGALASFALGSSNSSIITPINNWLTGMCGMPACTDSTVSSFVTNITSGCSQDLANLGIQPSSNEISDIVSQIQKFYSVGRNITCLEDTSTNTNCITELLTSVQQSVGSPLSITNIVDLAFGGDLSTLANLPSNVTCSSCVKAAYNIMNDALPSTVSAIAPTASMLCGASFIDGSAPSNIMDTAVTTTAASQHSAGTVLVPRNALISIAVSLLVAGTSVFMVLV